MPDSSQHYSDSANGWDVTIYWSFEYGDSSAYMWWEVNRNDYGRTFQLVLRSNTSTRYDSGRTIPANVEYYLYVYRSGAFSQQKGPFTLEVPPPPTYTVSYNANGGSGAPAAQTKTYNQTLYLSTQTPTRTGYDFLGWSTNSSASSAQYSAGGSYTANAGATLYAVWKLKTYTVSYNANGGSGAPGNQTKNYGQNLALSSTKPTRTGHTFVQWNTSQDGKGTAYQPGGTYTGNAALTLYAIWTPDTYAVTFNANGGTGAPSAQTKTYGVSLTLSSTKPTKTGYTFKNWNTASDGSGTSYSSGATYTGNAPLTLYAIWTANTYTVSYNANGGSGSMSDQSMTYDIPASLRNNAFSRAGHTFSGWSTAPGGTVVYQNGQSVSNLVTSNGGTITLYAVWSVNSITITFDAASNGGTTPEASRVINYGSAISTLPVAEKPYYKFVGWFTTPNGGSQVTEQTVFTANATIYARFVVDSSLSINVGGSWKKGIPYVKVSGVWKKGYAWVKNGSWKQGVG